MSPFPKEEQDAIQLFLRTRASLSLRVEGVLRSCPSVFPSCCCRAALCPHNTVTAHGRPTRSGRSKHQVSFSFLLRTNRPFTIYHGRRSRNLTPIFSSPSTGGEGFLFLAKLFVSRRFPFGITIHHTGEIPFMSILQNAAATEEGELYILFPTPPPLSFSIVQIMSFKFI